MAMTLEQIKSAVDNGQTVYWSNKAYTVQVKENKTLKEKDYFIVCSLNNSRIGLEWADGKGMNGKPEEFFVECPIELPERITNETEAIAYIHLLRNNGMLYHFEDNTYDIPTFSHLPVTMLAKMEELAVDILTIPNFCPFQYILDNDL